MIKCKIADLIVAIPTAGGINSRCGKYIHAENDSPDFEIALEEYNWNKWGNLPEDTIAYMESGSQFYRKLLFYNGIMLHASALEIEGKAFLFSGPSRVGKSTHARLWQQLYGSRVTVFNDDKPAVRKVGEHWHAYGTPWCGKNRISENKRVVINGICFLRQGKDNSIKQLNKKEAVASIISQTIRKFNDEKNLGLMLNVVDKLVQEIPIYELTNNATPESAILSYETMRRGAEEAGL